MTEVSNAKTAITEDKAASISADIQRFADLDLLDTLLLDRSTGGNIIWACKSYESLGVGYGEHDEIRAAAITGENVYIVRTRARKEQMERAALTKAHAEVFTPSWVCKKMIDHADEAWYAEIDDPESAWETYITSPRLEITCGEAPYLVNRYDAADGTEIPTQERIGILSRKLALATEHAKERDAWVNLALAACKSVYGYEFQGDNLLIARVNVLCTLEDFAQTAGFAPFTQDEYRQLAEIISWNLWQMDGITDCVPFGKEADPEPELRLPGFEGLFAEEDEQLAIDIAEGRSLASIYDWKNNAEVEFHSLKRKGGSMKFDYVIGNPPYQEETDNNGRQQPVHDKFMDGAYEVADIVELITPARFLFNAGQTTKSWNEKMLADKHLKVMMYETDSSKVFGNTDIKGGVAITYRDANKDFGAIEVFTAFPVLNAIVKKVADVVGDSPRLDSIFASQRLYKFSDEFFAENAGNPHVQFFLDTGTRNKILSSAMEKLPEIFVDTDSPSKDSVKFLGRIDGRRQYRYIKRRYLKDNDYLDAYKLFIPEANNSGKYGEPLTEPIIGYPGVGSADTFLNAGPFAAVEEPDNMSRYYKTKFFRALLGVRKVTQHCPAPVWRTIPLQDFTPSSDIDWSQSVADIDRQLYAKYGLSQEEIDFIESHVQEMS